MAVTRGYIHTKLYLGFEFLVGRRVNQIKDFLTSMFLDAKHEKIIGNNNLFFCLHLKASAYCSSTLSDIKTKNIFGCSFTIF